MLLLIKTDEDYKISLHSLKIHPEMLKKIIAIGLPTGIQSSIFSISNVVIQSSINAYGSTILAGSAASANIEGFVYVIMNSFHQTAVNFIGQNMGAHQYNRIKKIFGLCLIYVSIFGFAAGFTVWHFGEKLLSIYITDSQEAIQYGLIRFNYIALPYFVCGLMDVSTGSLRGLGASFTPMLISILGVCGIRIMWIYTVFQIPKFHTPECLYISYLMSWLGTFIFQTIAFIIIYKKRVRADKNISRMPEFKGEIS